MVTLLALTAPVWGLLIVFGLVAADHIITRRKK